MAERPDNAEQLQAEIIAAIELLPERDFTLAGLPDVKALEALLEYNISADERKAAWDAQIIDDPAEPEGAPPEDPEGSGAPGPGEAEAPAEPEKSYAGAVRVLIPGLSPENVQPLRTRIRSMLPDGCEMEDRISAGSKDTMIWIKTDDPESVRETCIGVLEGRGFTQAPELCKIEEG